MKFKFFKILSLFCAILFITCYHHKPIKDVSQAHRVTERTLFIALDGIDHTLMKELKDEGYFAAFHEPIPLVSTFPSATTIGFTGLFQPLDVGQVLGYEARFYSWADNKIMGGTPFDIYKIAINYKYYFDNFRHTMHEKGVMYTFPSLASKQDLVDTRKALFHNSKKIVMTYLGGMDGSAHMLGRLRTKRTLKYMDDFLRRLQEEHLKERGETLRIVLFSDHGFDYHPLKTVSNAEMQRKLAKAGFHLRTKIESDKDAVAVKFGLLTSGVMFARLPHRAEMARLVSSVTGLDLTFWHLDDERKIFIKAHDGTEAKFEYQGKNRYRYVPVTGDPLGYVKTLEDNGYHIGQWLSADEWLKITYDHNYPDAGYRLHDAFFRLVKNQASILFSLYPNYQYGSAPARVGTWAKLGQRGTHGGLFRQTSWAFAMTNLSHSKNPPTYLRYDQFFNYFLPKGSRPTQ